MELKSIYTNLGGLAFALIVSSSFAVAGTGDVSAHEKKSGVDIKGAVKMAKVYFVSPKDGDQVAPEFTAKFAIEGLKVVPAGAIVPGTGHFHVLIDSTPVAEGEVIPADEKHLHFGKAQMETQLKLSPGPHTLVLQFADGAHRAYHRSLVQEIKITVK